jgi:type I restriction enzyme M protein
LNTEEQQFLNDLDKKLWTAANKLLPMLDAAEQAERLSDEWTK